MVIAVVGVAVKEDALPHAENLPAADWSVCFTVLFIASD